MWRRTVLAALGLAAVGPVVAPGRASARGLDALRWRKRVVLVFAPPDDPRVGDQRAVLARLGIAGDDRDLLLVAVQGDRVVPSEEGAEALRRRYGVQAREFLVLLIGKDGGVKLRTPRVLDAGLLARTVDAMPMRRSEMSGRRGR
jgi:hypothetical protein